MGLYVIQREGADDEEKPEDVGVVIEGVELLCKLGSISFGCAMLFGLIYTLNLSYPQELNFTFEFFQKVLMNLDGNRLSPKVQALKIKMLHWDHKVRCWTLSSWFSTATLLHRLTLFEIVDRFYNVLMDHLLEKPASGPFGHFFHWLISVICPLVKESSKRLGFLWKCWVIA